MWLALTFIVIIAICAAIFFGMTRGYNEEKAIDVVGLAIKKPRKRTPRKLKSK